MKLFCSLVTYVFDVSSRELYKSNYSIIYMVKMSSSSIDEAKSCLTENMEKVNLHSNQSTQTMNPNLRNVLLLRVIRIIVRMLQNGVKENDYERVCSQTNVGVF